MCIVSYIGDLTTGGHIRNTILLKTSTSSRRFIVAYLTGLFKSSLSGFWCLWCWNKISLLITTISIMWKNNVFHQRQHFRGTLFVLRIWSDLSTALIIFFYLRITMDCFASAIVHLPSTFTLRFTATDSVAVSIDDNIVTILLSFHCRAKRFPYRSHLISPLSLPFAQVLPSFIHKGNPFWFSQTVPQEEVPCVYKSSTNFDEV